MQQFAVIFCLLASCFIGTLSYVARSKHAGAKIIGGTPANIEDFPYQVSLQFTSRHSCGASIISSEWALTAAHCIKEVGLSILSVRAGSAVHASGGSLHNVTVKLPHELFDPAGTIDYDIGLVKVSPPFTFSDTVQTITLPEPDERVAAGTMAVVTGWGKTKEDGGQLSPILLQVSVPVVDSDSCRKDLNGHIITDHMLCAGYPAGGKDICSSDSGGPLVADGKQIGVVSWSIGCGEANHPGVYAYVASLRSWIKTHSGV